MAKLALLKWLLYGILILGGLWIMQAPLLAVFRQSSQLEVRYVGSKPNNTLPGEIPGKKEKTQQSSRKHGQSSQLEVRYVGSKPNNTLPGEIPGKKEKTQQSSRKHGPDGACKFGKTLEENMEKIKSYNLSEADPYFHDLDAEDAMPEVVLKGTGTSNIEVPTIVTGASSNHFLESLEMLKSLNKVVRPAYKTIQVFYYDLGLEPEEQDQVRKLCNCTVVKFPFEKYPDHVRVLKGYCWKPIIVKIMMQRWKFVMWMDASVQFKKSDLDPLFTQAKKLDVLMWMPGGSLAAHTHQDTFKFLNETPCLYRSSEFHAGLIFLHGGNSVVKKYIVDPWAKCALIEDCMKTKHDEKKMLKCPSSTAFHSCHRFDQSIISILVYRLYHDSYRNHNIALSYFRLCWDLSCPKISIT